jgi:hypothetical protein
MYKLLRMGLALGAALLVQPALAGVTVTTSGNQALANISLSNGTTTYTADVTITFDNVINLSAVDLNLSAQLVNPTDPAITSRLPGCLPIPACVSVDPAFPVLITVEPLTVPWLFASGFEGPSITPEGNLGFLNTYDFEVHTGNLVYVNGTSYRLFKAPLSGVFADISTAVTSGSVRARGSGGTFSQFMVVSDQRHSALVATLVKSPALRARILIATLTTLVSGDLLTLLDSVDAALLLSDYTTALTDVNAMISELQAHAGVDIANAWSSDHTLVNDAGELLSLANTLAYTLGRLQAGNTGCGGGVGGGGGLGCGPP